MGPIPNRLLSLSKPVSVASWGVPYERLMKRNSFDLQMILHAVWASPKSGQLQHHSPFLGHPWRTCWREISPRLLMLLVRRKSQRSESISVHGLCGQWFSWMVRDLEGKYWKTGGRKVWGRGMWMNILEWEKKVKLSLSYVNAHKGVPLPRRLLIIKWIGRPVLWIPVSCFPCYFPMGVMKKFGTVAGTET